MTFTTVRRRIARWSAEDTRHYRSAVRTPRVRDAGTSEASRTIALILVVVVGIFGVHRFYVGRLGSGLGMLFTPRRAWHLVVG